MIADLYDNILAAAWVIGGRFWSAFYKNGNSQSKAAKPVSLLKTGENCIIANWIFDIS